MHRKIIELRVNSLLAENEALKQLILQANNMRIEASDHAEKLAEANYYLENCLAEAYVEVYNLRHVNKRLSIKL